MPVTSMAECIEGMLHVVYGDDIDSQQPGARNIDRGFRTAPLLRILGTDDSFLSLSSALSFAAWHQLACCFGLVLVVWSERGCCNFSGSRSITY